MAIETEIKIAVAGWDALKAALQPLGPKLLTERHFEDNYVLDDSRGTLRAGSCLLRVRKTGDLETITFKGPPKASLLFKSREELELSLGSADVMLDILSRLGFGVWFRYQKYREEYALTGPAAAGRELRLALDYTPIGDYLELEGSEESILEAAARLGFKKSQFLRDSYYALYARHCQDQGQPVGHMVFGAP